MNEDERTLGELERALPRVAPPAGLFDRVRTELDPPRPSPLRRRRPLAAGIALAVAAVVAVVFVVSTKGPGGPTATASIVSHRPGAAVRGTARLYRVDTSRGTLRLDLKAVPTPPAGHHYEVWVLGAGQTEMTAVGSFTPGSSSVRLRLPLPAPGNYRAVDVSIQENGGPAEHSGVSLAGGTFRQRG